MIFQHYERLSKKNLFSLTGLTIFAVRNHKTMEKIHLEFPLNSNSRSMIWDRVGTTGGMEAWMADRITEDAEGLYTFSWGGGETRHAELVAKRIGTYVRFRWTDESPKTYWELRITFSEMTNTSVLEVTEQTDDEDTEGLIQLWESFAEQLSRRGGI